jgi:aspartate racemase
MKRVGIVGGLGHESTVDYYRRILAATGASPTSPAPGIVIDSLDVQRGLHLVEHDHQGLLAYLLESLDRLARAGVDFAVIAANTAHVVFDELAADSPVPLLSIVEACVTEAQRQGWSRVGILGTRFTMAGSFYPATAARMGIAVVPPTEAERSWMHQLYVGELLRGEFHEATRKRFAAVVARLRDEEGIEGVILAGTELPLLLPSPTIAGVPALDSTAAHVAAIAERLLGACPQR